MANKIAAKEEIKNENLKRSDMFISRNMYHTAYKTPEEREKIEQRKKHEETCAKNKRKRKSKKQKS